MASPSLEVLLSYGDVALSDVGMGHGGGGVGPEYPTGLYQPS